jgi:predicted nucleotidyltransferase
VTVIYTIDELKRMIAPIAVKYDLPAVYVFGSYARGDATDQSDIDVLIDKTGSKVISLFDMGGLFNELNESLGKGVDLVTLDALEQDDVKRRTPWFAENLRKEAVMVYERY